MALYNHGKQQNTKTNTYENTPTKASLIIKQLLQLIAKQQPKSVINSQIVRFQNHAHLSTKTPVYAAFFEKKFQTLKKKSYLKSHD